MKFELIHHIWPHLKARWYFRSAARLGARARVWGKVSVKNEGSLYIGEHVRMEGGIVPVELGIGVNGTLEIGDRTYIKCSFANKLAELANGLKETIRF